jgi:hypothetical protein
VEASRSDLEATIRQVIHELLELPITPHIRELRAKAVTYGRVINNWSTYPPTAPQVQAMRECVAELHEKVRAAQREISRVSRRPTDPSAQTPSVPRRTPQVPPPTTIPPGIAWNANVNDATGIRPRARRDDLALTPPESPAATTTSRPPGRPATAPPSSTPRTIDTPTPALLRSRRSR